MKGTVTISINDYDSLRGAKDSSLKKDERLTRAAKEGTKINLIEGRAKIIFENEEN